MPRRALALLLVATLFVGVPAQADDALTVSVSEQAAGAFTVTGAFTVPAEGAVVWQVLTDYDQLGAFIPSMTSAIVRREGASTVLVSQATTTWFVGVPRTTRVVLRLQEAPPKRIDFTDVAHQDFERYQGSWRVEADGHDTRVSYEASAKPKFVPPLVGKAIMQGTVKGLLQDLRKEVLRRRSAG